MQRLLREAAPRHATPPARSSKVPGSGTACSASPRMFSLKVPVMVEWIVTRPPPAGKLELDAMLPYRFWNRNSGLSSASVSPSSIRVPESVIGLAGRLIVPTVPLSVMATASSLRPTNARA